MLIIQTHSKNSLAWEKISLYRLNGWGDGSCHHGRRYYLLSLFHPNRVKEPKLTSSAPSTPTIYQTSVTKLLKLEDSTPYLKNLSKEDQRDWKRAQSLHTLVGLVLISVNRHEEENCQYPQSCKLG